MLKAITVSTLHRQILFLFCFFAGSRHDYALMKKVFNPKLNWFHQVNVWLDLGFQGAAREYGSKSRINLPHKRPRKSKNNPKPQLTAAQIKHNKAHARIRVTVEHAIGGMKAFHCLTHRIRNHLTGLVLASGRALEPQNSLEVIEIIGLCSGNNSLFYGKQANAADQV